MRPVSGLDRPAVQWLLVALSLVLMALAGWGAVGLRRAGREVERLRAADLEGRLQRDQLEARLAREQSTRESLALELARARSGTVTAEKTLPTLTLTPLRARGATPPQATVTAPPPDALIELRLVLPRAAERRGAAYDIVVRSWSGGGTIWTRGAILSSSRDGRTFVPARMAGDVLAPGSYEVSLFATAADGTRSEVASYEVTVSN